MIQQYRERTFIPKKVILMLWRYTTNVEQADEINKHGLKIDKTDSNLLPIASKSIRRT